jgi:hypothetical protein
LHNYVAVGCTSRALLLLTIVSKRGAQQLLRDIVKKAGGIRGWSELELWLKLLYPDGAYTWIAQYQSKEE